MAPIVLWAAWSGGFPFLALVAIGTTIMAWEWNHLAGNRGIGWAFAALLISVIIVMPLTALHLTVGAVLWLGVWALVIVVAIWRGYRPLAWIGAGVIYIGVPALSLIWLREFPTTGRSLLLWLLLVVWATDILAYFAGKLIGGPRLAPRISPGKTWAGLAGGVIAAAAVAAIAGSMMFAPQSIKWFAVLGALLAIVAQLGDLLESGLKRRRGIKDSGGLIPGHGGLMDRIDGLVTGAPFFAIIAFLSGGDLAQWR